MPSISDMVAKKKAPRARKKGKQAAALSRPQRAPTPAGSGSEPAAWALARRRSEEAARLIEEQGAFLEQLLAEWESKSFTQMDCGEFVSPGFRGACHWPQDPRSLFPEPDNHALLAMARRLQQHLGRLDDLGAVELALRALQEGRLAQAQGVRVEDLRSAKSAAVARWAAHKRKVPFASVL